MAQQPCRNQGLEIYLLYCIELQAVGRFYPEGSRKVLSGGAAHEQA